MLRRLVIAWVAMVALSAAAMAQDDAPDEIVVWGDLFARWDETRWSIATELGVPLPMLFTRDQNLEFQTMGFQVRAVVGCSKEWKLGRKRYEVDCAIEDIAIQASIAQDRIREKDIERAQLVLDEIDAKLTGAAIQLKVADDGRVTGIDLEGVTKTNRRESEMHETLRQVLSRLVVGFNLKLRKWNQLHEGKWTEYNSSVLHLPALGGMSPNGSNMLVHYLNKYRGHLLVQSIGKGVSSLNGINYTTELIGVSIFDGEDGFMTERVWAVDGQSTASALFQNQSYFHAGKITMLGERDRPDVGPTRPVSAPKNEWPGLPKWEPIER